MEQRKYFKYGIQQLEELYVSAGENCAVLEELEEELHHRSTHRARQLLSRVKESLDWAISNENLLNVAVSRAKQSFYVVSNKAFWENLGNMKLISRYVV